MPGVVKLLDGMLQPAKMLHGAAGAAAVDYQLLILANAEGGIGKVGNVPLIHVPLEPTQVGVATVKFDDPAQLR